MSAETRGRIPGEPGLWIFIIGDLLVFGVFFATYLYYRHEEPAVFAASQMKLNQNIGLISTLVLLTSSLFVSLGVKSFETCRGRRAPIMFGLSLLLGVSFIGLKIFDYAEKIQIGLTPETDGFFSFFYVLTGIHLFHVILGSGLLAVIVLKSRSGQGDNGRFTFIEGGACLWHLVDILWIVLYPLLYFVR